MPKNFSLTLKRRSAFFPRKAQLAFLKENLRIGDMEKKKFLGISNIEIDMK